MYDFEINLLKTKLLASISPKFYQSGVNTVRTLYYVILIALLLVKAMYKFAVY